jgi:hypothetical protein
MTLAAVDRLVHHARLCPTDRTGSTVWVLFAVTTIDRDDPGRLSRLNGKVSELCQDASLVTERPGEHVLICPSVCPLVQDSRTALRTASISCRNVLTKRRMP